MASGLRPLTPLGSPPINATVGQVRGMTPDAYADLRRRQSLADALVADAKNPSDAAGSMFGAIAQGVKGYAGASMRQQNAADIAGFAQASPLAASRLSDTQPPAMPDPVAGIGSLFGRFENLFRGGAESTPGLLVPDPDNRAAASISTWAQQGQDE